MRARSAEVGLGSGTDVSLVSMAGPISCRRSLRRGPTRGAGALSTLPVALRGQLVDDEHPHRHLVRREPLAAPSPEVVGGATSAPRVRTTNATPASPHRGCGVPTTAAWLTAGWACRAFSTSAGYTFSPPEMYMSFHRSTSTTCPSSVIVAASPVCSQPSSVNASAVAVGLRQ